MENNQDNNVSLEKLKEAKATLENIKDNYVFRFLSAIFSENNDPDAVYNGLSEIIDALEEANKEETPEQPSKPSDALSFVDNVKCHELTTEYVDSVIRPVTTASNEVINEAYVQLFEFCAWLMQKENLCNKE